MRVHLLFLSLATFVISGCVQGYDSGPSSPLFPTQAPTEGDRVVMQALYEGRVLEQDGCLRLESDSSHTVIWPPGFTLHRRDGEFQVVDERGGVIGTIGGHFRFGGGEVPRDTPLSLADTEMERELPIRCRGRYWIVGETSSEEANQPSRLVGREGDDPEAHLLRLKAVIRQDALTSYGEECGSLTVPDDAFLPVEITGGGLPELAVPFGRVHCGIGQNRFSGTGGVMVQFWIGSGGPVRLLLEQQMHGFTPSGNQLITMQHGGFCPGGAGPDQCRVVYQWNDKDRRLDVIERRLASSLGELDPMTFDWEMLFRRR